MKYCSYKNLTRKTASNKILHDKPFKIAGNPSFDVCQCTPVSMVYKLFDKKSAHVTIISNQQLANELNKSVVRKLQGHNVYPSFGEIICVADLAEMQLISKSDERVTLLLCIIGIYSNFVWIAQLKDQEGVTVVDALQKIIDKSNRKPDKI